MHELSVESYRENEKSSNENTLNLQEFVCTQMISDPDHNKVKATMCGDESIYQKGL